MTRTFDFPSEQFPAFPAFTVAAPDEWSAISASGVVLAIGREIEEGEFRPNLVVSVSRFAAGYQLATAIEAVSLKFASLPDMVEIGREERPVLSAPGFRLEASFTDARVGSLAQAIHIAVLDRGPVVDLVQITATASAAQAMTLWPEIREIQNSVALRTQ